MPELITNRVGRQISVPTAAELAAATSTTAGKIPLTQKGVANGVATLDGDGTVPDGQIPTGITRDTELAAQVSAAVTALVAGAPGALDTLYELATALGNDQNFGATVTAALALRARLDIDQTYSARQTIDAPATQLTLKNTAGGGGAVQVILDRVAGQVADLRWTQGGVRRWLWRLNTDTESGGDVGSMLQLIPTTDTGTLKTPLFQFLRNGPASLGETPTEGGPQWMVKSTADRVTAVAKKNAGQTADIWQGRESDDTVLGRLTKDGQLSGRDLRAVGKNGISPRNFTGRKTTSGPPTGSAWVLDDEVIDPEGFIWRCTVAGTPGTWALVNPPRGRSLMPTGVKAETVSRLAATWTDAPRTSGRLHLVAIELIAGDPITSLGVLMGTSGTTTPTHQWFSLFDSARNRLALTVDDLTTAWAANQLKSLAITGGPYVPTYTGLHYIGQVVVAGNAGQLKVVSGGGLDSAIIYNQAPILFGFADLGLTDPASCPATASALLTPSTGTTYAIAS